MVGKILPPTQLIHVFCVALTSIVIIQDEKLTFIVVCWGFIYSITFFRQSTNKTVDAVRDIVYPVHTNFKEPHQNLFS